MVQEFAHANHETTFLLLLWPLITNPKMLPQFLQLLLAIESIVIVAFEHYFLHPIFLFLVLAVAVDVAVLVAVAAEAVVLVHPHPPAWDPLACAASDGLLEVAVLAGGEDHVVAV